MSDVLLVLANAQPSEEECSNLASWVNRQLELTKNNFNAVLRVLKGTIAQV